VDEQQLASWGRRLAALLVDVIVLVVAISVALVAAGMPADELRDRVENGETLLVIVLFLIPEAIYYTWMVGSRSQTVGKMAVGIKIVDAESRAPIGYLRAFRRWLSTAAMRALFWIPAAVFTTTMSSPANFMSSP